MDNSKNINDYKIREIPRILLIPIRLIGFLLFLFLFFILILKFDFVQNWAKDQVLGYINKHYEQQIEVDRFYLDPLKGLTATVLIRDHHQDTLFHTKELKLGLLKSLVTLYNKNLSLEDIDLTLTVFKIIQYPGENETNLTRFVNNFKDSTKSPGTPLDLSIQKIRLNQTRFYYWDQKIEVNFTIDQITTIIDSLNTRLKYYRLRKILLESPQISLISHSTGQNSVDKPELSISSSDSCEESSGIYVDFINVNNGKLDLEISNHDTVTKHSFQHVFLSSFNAYLSNDLTQIDFINLNGKSKDGFHLKNAAIRNFKFNEKQFNIDKLDLETTRSNIDLRVHADFDPQNGNHNWEKAFMKVDLNPSLIDPKDISFWIPQWNLYNFIRAKTEYPFYLKGTLYGDLNNLKGQGIEFKYEDQFSFKGNLHARNLLLRDKELINLKIERLSTNASFVRMIFPEYHIPATYNSFGNIQLTGNFDGYFHDFVAFGHFKTDLGDLQSDIKVKLSRAEKTAVYNGTFHAIGLDLGKLLGKPELGKINMKAKILNGKGLTKEKLQANVEAVISELNFRGYKYRDILFIGRINNNQFQGDLKVSDTNADLQLSGIVNVYPKKYEVILNSKISRIDLKALYLTKDSVVYSGEINCNLAGSTESDLNGTLEVKNSKCLINKKSIVLTKLFLEQSATEANRKLKLNSDVLNFEIEGNYQFQTLKDEILAYLIDKYPGLANVLSLPEINKVSPTSAKGFLYIKDGIKFNTIFNLPVELHKADCDFIFDNKKNVFEVSSNRFDLRYKNLEMSKFSLDFRSGDELNFVMTSDYFSNDQAKITGNFKFAAQYDGHNGQSIIQLFDSTNSKIMANVPATFSYDRDTFQLSFLRKDLFFNNTRWVINTKNKFTKTRNYFSIDNFELTDSLHFLSLQDYKHKGIIVKTDGFDISFVNPFIKNESINFYGLFASELIIPDLQSVTGSSGKINIFQLHFNKDNFGPFAIDFSIVDIMKPWLIRVENIFQEHIIKGTGSINIPVKKEGYQYSPYDFTVDLTLNAFPVNFLENFIGSISNTTGHANGRLNFFSEDTKLYLTGDLNLVKGSTNINYLGVPIKFDKQPVQFTRNSIIFDKLTIQDKFGNPLNMNGKLTHNHLKGFVADVHIQSSKALILDTKKGNDIYYYGYGIGSIDANFTGPFDKMDIDVTVESLPGSKVNIPILYGQVSSESRFVKFSSHQKKQGAESIPEANTIEGLQLNMKLNFTEDAEISIIFDELAGDIIKARGRGNLVIKSLRNGLFTVNGSYEVEQGQYLFTLYEMVNKPFTIRRGGAINWSGDPLNADVNIEAVYEGLYVSLTPLINAFPLTDEERDEASRRTDVNVRMMLTGSLLKPNIKFDIDLPELTGDLKNYADYRMRELRENEDQLNQQVFGLLVLRTFISSTNITGDFIGNFNALNIGINTVSEMLGNQFSLFISNLLSNAVDDVNVISGIDVNIGYELSKNSLGTTALDEGEIVFSFKPKLWNDKLIFSFGGNYKTNASASLYGNSAFNPESVIEWNTPVKGLKLRVYYKADEYIEGVKHKIGTGINYRKEFDSFSDFEEELKTLSRKYKQERENAQGR